MGPTVSEPATLTRWRYWRVDPHGSKLVNNDPTDSTCWEGGTARAVCRHDPTHAPPHAGCRCGVYAIGRFDIHAAAAGYGELVATVRRSLQREYSGHLGLSPAVTVSADFYERERLFRRYGQRHELVLGEVQLSNAVPHARGNSHFRAWRAESAAVKRLYVPPAALNGEALAERLAERYGVPADVGLPGYSEQDWTERTPGFDHDHKRLGLGPAGWTPRRPTRYFTAKLPGA